jgi:hypothetical protein
MVAEGIMELIADILGKYQGEKIEVLTNGGQTLIGVVGDAYRDYFMILSVTRLYFVPYTGISTFHLVPESDLQQATIISDIDKESPGGRTQQQVKERKQVPPKGR